MNTGRSSKRTLRVRKQVRDREVLRSKFHEKNRIGIPELISVWTDPDFDASLSAFYYARVIEIPTPRWTAYEALRFGIDMPTNVPMTTQERAYTSPIWYTREK